MTRREAMQLVAAAGPLGSRLFGAGSAHGWAGYVTSAMLVDDVRRLLTIDTRAPKALRSAVLKDGEAARLGCGLPKPDGAVSLDWAPARLAVAGGAMIAHSGAAVLSVVPDAVALDAALLAARHPVEKPLPKAAYLQYLQAMDLRSQIELHTLDPEGTEIHQWLEGTAGWFQKTRSYMDALATALASGAGSPAFNAADPLFRLSERVRRSEAVGAREFEGARATSTYGKAMAAALDALAKVG